MLLSTNKFLLLYFIIRHLNVMCLGEVLFPKFIRLTALSFGQSPLPAIFYGATGAGIPAK